MTYSFEVYDQVDDDTDTIYIWEESGLPSGETKETWVIFDNEGNVCVGHETEYSEFADAETLYRVLKHYFEDIK